MRLPCLALLLPLLAGCPRDVELAAPPAGQGFQLQAGPFEVPSNTETQRCFFAQVPGKPDQDVWVNRYQLSQNEGTHHVNVFRVKTVSKLSGNPGEVVSDGECWKSPNWADWPIVVNSQDDQADVDWKLPEGVGARFHGGELLMLQVHYVNASTQQTPKSGKVFVNFWTSASPPPNELGTIFATNQNIKICPGDTDKTFEARCTFHHQGATVVAANGHFHSRGRKFTIAPVDERGGVGQVFYTSENWKEPPMNHDLSVALPEGGGIDWRCSYTAEPDTCGDTGNSCCFTFGPKVETQEHCNAFVYYYPKQADITCF